MGTGHPILRDMVLKTPDYLAPRELLFLEERSNLALWPYPYLRNSQEQPLSPCSLSGVQVNSGWNLTLETHP